MIGEERMKCAWISYIMVDLGGSFPCCSLVRRGGVHRKYLSFWYAPKPGKKI